MDKSSARHELQFKRAAMPQEQVINNSKLIVQHILDSELYKKANIIMGYLSFGKEASIDLALQQALVDGKIVCVPQVVYGSNFMQAVRITGMKEFCLDKFGIRTPMEPYEVIRPQTLNLVLVPGVGFTKRGERMGMGKGYYDQFLPQATQAALVGVAHSLQVAAAIPTDEYDITMQYLVTERLLMACDKILE